MHLCLFEDDQVEALLPLAATRAVYDLRLGIRTLLETTRDAFGGPPTVLHARPLIDAVTALEHSVPTNQIPDGADVLFINGRYIAEEGDVLTRLRQAARPGEPGRVFVQRGDLVGAWVPGAASHLLQTAAVTRATFGDLPEENVEGARWIGRLWHLIDEIGPALVRDFGVRTAGVDLRDRSGANIHARVDDVEAAAESDDAVVDADDPVAHATHPVVDSDDSVVDPDDLGVELSDAGVDLLQARVDRAEVAA
jgi:hypothetical protein